MKILAISGSLRANSYNSAIVKALKKLNNNNTDVEIYTSLGEIPLFNPDLDNHTLDEDFSPYLIQELRKKISLADAIVISTPEYVFEIPGALKNAIDWLVSSSVVVNKPFAIISASTSGMGGDKANDVLVGLVKVLTGRIQEPVTLTVDRVNKKFDDAGNIIDTTLITELKNLLIELERTI